VPPTRKWIAAASALGCLAFATGAGAVAAVGGPPSDDYERCVGFLRPCTDPVVIGVGRHFNGPVEIVAFQSSYGLCIDIDQRRGGGGSCAGSPLPPHGDAIFASGYGRGGDASQVSGELRPAVARVAVRYRRAGQMRRSRGLVAQVAGELLEKVGEPRPFGFFEATVRGCVPPQRFRVAAFDSSGVRLGRSRLPDFPGSEC
jgi:hypothetical protein